MEFLVANKVRLVGLASVVGFVALTKKYFNGGSCTSKARLDGKTVIITGANTGIGKETALDLAKRGARVILACRDLNRALKSAEEIRKKTGNGNVFVEILDLASFDSIRSFSEKINKQEERIDILINNAGVMWCPKMLTNDGFEMQFGVNHLGHFLLTNLLLDKIKSSAPSRIINVSSRAYMRGTVNFDDLNSDKAYDPRLAYAQSKLCNVLFTRELAKRLPKDSKTVTVNTLHPGVVRTELGRYMGETLGLRYYLATTLFYPIMLLMLKSSEQGAQTTIHLAVSEEVGNVSGLYFADCAPQELLPKAQSDADAQRLWEVSEKLCKLK